jgi:diadenosine tetraphosphatase ApaH/serine/threonine PP2A family protein phosphatase
MKAVLSDIHGNLEALQAVLADLSHQAVTEIYCLGDLVVYGPNPRECVEMAMPWKVALMGNFDLAVLPESGSVDGFPPCAGRSVLWSRRQLDAPIPSSQVAERRWGFLGGLRRRHLEQDFLFVHGSARNPLHEWVFPEDIYNQEKMRAVFAAVERYCFQGHTHVPGIFTEGGPFRTPEELGYIYRLDDRKTLCNVGSVGQPRDGDWRACYILLDGDTIQFRRVEYDVEATIKKIRDIDDLDDFLGDRLGDGR